MLSFKEVELAVPNPVTAVSTNTSTGGGDPFKMIKAASLVVRRNPDDIEAWLTLAAVVNVPDERDSLQWEAVRAGRNLRRAKAAVGQPTGWGDPDMRLLAHALYAHARASGLDGRRDIALVCVREMLEIDPSDRIGAEELAQELALISSADATAGMAMCL